MKKLYTAVGRMQFKGRNRDMRCPMVLLNNKEYILDIQEMMIWSILNWRILSDDEIKTLYENKAQETGYGAAPSLWLRLRHCTGMAKKKYVR